MPQHEFHIPVIRAAAWSQEALQAPENGGILDLASGPPDLAWIDPLLRRRLSPMARGMLHCAERVAPQKGDMRTIFASRHGEVARTLPILEDLARNIEISPTLFSMNVHNAVAGVWSILKANHAASTSIAAGPETFTWGLLLAYETYQSDPTEPVLYVFGEDRMPELLAGFDPAEEYLHAVALLIGAPAAHDIIVRWDPARNGQRTTTPQSLHGIQSLRGLASSEPWAGPTGSWDLHVA